MRFLIVNKFLYPNGGSETYIFGLGKQLEAMGHEVQYFGMEHPDRCVGNAVGAYTSNMDFHAGSGKTEDNSLSRKIKKLTLPIRIIYSREAREQIRRVLDDFAPDVVHLNNINFQITPSIIYEIRKWEKDTGNKCRIIFTAHDYQWICPNHMMYVNDTPCNRCKGGRFIECTKHNCIHGSKARSIIGSAEGYYYKWRKTYEMVDLIIAPSRFLYDKFAENPVFKDKLVMMHNFIEKTSDKQISGNNSEDSYVLYFGRFAREKGITTLMNAARNLPEIPFIFAGSGPLESDVRALAKECDNVEFVGFKTGDDLKRLISGAAFSVYPSEWYENCPFSVMESISLGTPVLGADIGGIPELITGEGTENTNACGELFIPGDVDNLTDKIHELWNNEPKQSEYKTSCFKTAFDDLKEYTDKIIRIIEGNNI